MQLTKLSITALFTLLATTSVAAPAPDSVDARMAEAAPGQDISGSADAALEKRGFGCPVDKKCHNHCKTVTGYKGGYCEGFLDLRLRVRVTVARVVVTIMIMAMVMIMLVTIKPRPVRKPVFEDI
ncbi:uncharacterized protein J7T54_005173 [Emericellopsis cladophorae]|uniref:Invertebrate defensins family profile domain-containing protein n=1 Tax=Emericellopsis cladophorae TaxID=2686198 RepID=A0A9P9Y1V1_9HYPO|nr:uncharacterized protein J7T54_005173 [Emericellopsis cladophorae]KAI6781962.1 hypothetical protein J7T54_005173 [Emericellopsis cladophorae]